MSRPDQDPPAGAVAAEPEIAEEVPPGWNDAPTDWWKDWDAERPRPPVKLALGGPSYMILYVDDDAESLHGRSRSRSATAYPMTRAEARTLYRWLRQMLYSGDEEIEELYQQVHGSVVAEFDKVLQPLRARK